MKLMAAGFEGVSAVKGDGSGQVSRCDGELAVPLGAAPAQKRNFDGDESPNTGGMGSHSPVPDVDAETVEELARRLARVVPDDGKGGDRCAPRRDQA